MIKLPYNVILSKVGVQMIPEFYFVQKNSDKRNVLVRSFILAIMILLYCGLVTACNKVNGETFPRREVSLYIERIISVPPLFSLDVECDYGNIEFYNWDRQEIKFEITHKVRDSKPVSQLEMMLERFKTSTGENQGSVKFSCSYKGKEGSYEDTFTVIRVFLPDKPVTVSCRLQQGRLSFLDDLETVLLIDTGNTDVKINRLKGTVKYNGENGSFNIDSGFINSKSSIVTKNGNIKIKADFENPGLYKINTGTGIIALDLPESLDAVFESNGSIDTEESTNTIVCSKFLIKNDIGKVEINRF